jgi:hypothetical protein
MPVGPIPKYALEVALNFVSVDRFLYRVTDLLSSGSAGPDLDLDPDSDRGLLSRLDDCHLYIIGTRPRLSIVPGSLQVTSTLASFQVEFKLNGVIARSDWNVERELLLKEETSFDISEYPHRELIGRGENGQVVTSTLLANAAHLIPSAPPGAKDLEVLYVGKGLKKSAQDRVKHHTTVQRILASVGSDQPDKEVFVLVFAFELRRPIVSFQNIDAEVTGAAASRRWTAIKNRLNLEDQIALAEAASIAYFRPVYNIQYLDFPQKTHRIVRDIAPADYSAIIVNLDQDPIGGLRIFSRGVAPASYHQIIVDFRRRENKLSVFGGPEYESLYRNLDDDELKSMSAE